MNEREQAHLTGQALYERASDSGAAPWEDLSPEGRSTWARAERVLSDGLLRLASQPENPGVSLASGAEPGV